MLYDHIKERMLAHPAQTIGDERRVMTYRELLEDAERMGRGLDRAKYGILCRSELDTARALLACFSPEKRRCRCPTGTATAIPGRSSPA